jgi:uncharacterized protein with NRDE domain
MCLILVAWQMHPEYPLVVAANRDEFYARPAAEADHWPEDPRILGGRDLEAGGTWLALREDGRFAAVTNVREASPAKGERSRGHLPAEFLRGDQDPGAYTAAIDGTRFQGFNLLLADPRALWYCSNRDGAARELGPGIYGVSNHLLDTPWPKLVSAKARFAHSLASLPALGGLFTMLADSEIVPDPWLPSTGVPLECERMLSAIFVQSEAYGTRASTVLTRRRNGAFRLEERRFGAGGAPLGVRRIRS